MRIPRKRYLIAIFLLLFLLFKFVEKIDIDKSPADRFKVVNIIDGDTFELAGGDRLRLLALDTPEKGEPFYDSAKNFLASLALGKNVEVAYSKKKRDGYGRLLGYVYLNSVWINREIIRNGLAHVYLFDDNIGDKAKIDSLLLAQQEAMANEEGVWSIKRKEEKYYLATKNSFRFHRPQCKSISKQPIEDLIRFDFRAEAFRQGYSPCRNCRP
jgi:micrococcal nuclease